MADSDTTPEALSPTVVDVLVGILGALERKRIEDEVLMVANGLGEDDPVPGLAPDAEDGSIATYRSVGESREAQERRLSERWPAETIRARELLVSREAARAT